MIAAVRKEIADETDREIGVQNKFQVHFILVYIPLMVFQLRVCFEKDVTKQEAMWERQHEFAAGKIYNMCSDLGGFFLNSPGSFQYFIWLIFMVAQIIGKPDLAPAAWVRRLVTLCDQSPATPYDVIQVVLEKDLGQSVDGLFERFEVNPLGSASIAQVTEVSD
ncbi:putative aarF domain-containing protein kinase 1 [Camellia lanceoleosa]|uniref:AarF domain-containing protein kinase 1 n=1 Tax=Camellia lanceoleosa TaxID=1840588 RepID=A0ACC0G8X0_9ERIC|nr:putative aarF domain-containing protein kinase 1 [Camellia lanceoleosa]